VASLPGSSAFDGLQSLKTNPVYDAQLSNTQYTIADINTSDHRPVYAAFILTVHVIDDRKKQIILDELSKVFGGKSAREDAGAKPKVDTKRPPPGVPDRAKKTAPESNLISFEEKTSPSKGMSTASKSFRETQLDALSIPSSHQHLLHPGRQSLRPCNRNVSRIVSASSDRVLQLIDNSPIICQNACHPPPPWSRRQLRMTMCGYTR
jgi:hypothetical protein